MKLGRKDIGAAVEALQTIVRYYSPGTVAAVEARRALLALGHREAEDDGRKG